MTPTDIMRALDAGLTDLKLFPAASAGGIAHLRALAAPFPMIRFIPTGGIGPSNLAAYLAEPSVLAAGGSWMVRPDVLEAGDWDAVRTAAAGVVAIVRSVRGPAAGGGAPVTTGEAP
jgi:2-dehydro-3-deoxyphosphogluconate aldolase/(4S)-4-hydroxy-2-oxoglutarate aldolase